MCFCQDFQVFPYLFSKAKLNQFFNGFSKCLKINLNDNKSVHDYIDHSMFADIIVLCALEIKYRDTELGLIEKVKN